MITRLQFDLLTEAVMIPAVRRQVDALLQHFGVTPDDIYRAGIVITEACSNVVRHAYDQPRQWYRLKVEYQADKLTVEVTDEGRGFRADNVPEPKPGQIGGYGVFFIREAADSVEYTPLQSSGTRLTAELSLHYESQEALDHAHKLDLTC